MVRAAWGGGLSYLALSFIDENTRLERLSTLPSSPHWFVEEPSRVPSPGSAG